MLKRLEIQCVFKELVKDIVVKGHEPNTRNKKPITEKLQLYLK